MERKEENEQRSQHREGKREESRWKTLAHRHHFHPCYRCLKEMKNLQNCHLTSPLFLW